MTLLTLSAALSGCAGAAAIDTFCLSYTRVPLAGVSIGALPERTVTAILKNEAKKDLCY